MNKNSRLLRQLVRECLLSEAYYDLNPLSPPPIDYVINEWKKGNKADPAETYHAMYLPSELWPYREYTWNEDTASGKEVMGKDKSLYQDKWHFVPLDAEGLIVGRSKWNFMFNELKTKGWNPRDPLHLEVGKNGVAKVGEGNHRLAIAKELGIHVPVLFTFKNFVEKSAASNA